MPSGNILWKGMDCWAVWGIPLSFFARSTTALISLCCFRFRFAGIFISLACGFFLKNNSLNLLFKLILTHQSVVIVVRLIRSNLGTNKFCLNEMSCNDFQRLTVLFVHSQKEQGKHDNHHGQCRKAYISCSFDQKENRHPNECRRAETDQLSFCQIEEHLCFYPRQVTGYGDICCHEKPPSLVGREHALCKRTGLKEGEAQKNRVSHDTPDRSDNVLAESDRLHQHRIDAD